jgi:hypothetical protein
MWLILGSLVSLFPAASISQATTTTVTFSIVPFTGGLSINVPGTGAFPSLEDPETDTVVTATMESVTVTDTRRPSVSIHNWTTTATITDLRNGADSLTAVSIGYSSGSPTVISGSVAATEYTRTSLNATANVEAGISNGSHVVSWTPTLSIPVKVGQKKGTYIGVLTHSVS